MTPGNARRLSARNLSLKAGAAVACAVALAAGPLAGGAHAAKTTISIEASSYPADWYWDGVSTPAPTPSTGSWWAGYSVNYDQTPTPPYKTQQLRGGAVIEDSSGIGPSAPTSVLPGDVFRITNTANGAPLGEAAFPAELRATSSVIGGTSFVVQTSPGVTRAGASLFRRVARNVNTTVRSPNVFTWEKRVCPFTYDHDSNPATPEIRDPAECSTFDDAEWDEEGVTWESPSDVRPTNPSSAELSPTEYWYLKRTTVETYTPTTRPSSEYELVSPGQLTSVTPTGIAGSFGVPMQPGDLIDIWQETHTIAADTAVRLNFDAVVPVGTVPPPDVTAPVVGKIELGVASTTIGSFLKSGLRSFVTLDSPGTVKQTLLERQAKPKKPKKGKKPKKVKPPVVVAEASAQVAVAGGTAQLTLKPSKKGKSFLKSKKGKTTKLTLVTTATDAAGNVSTNERVLTLKKGK